MTIQNCASVLFKPSMTCATSLRLRSLCTSAQSDQGLRCSLVESIKSIHYGNDQCTLSSDYVDVRSDLSMTWSHVIRAFSIRGLILFLPSADVQ